MHIISLGEFIISDGSPQVQKYFDSIRLPGYPDKMNLTKLGWLLQAVADDGADAFYNRFADEIVSVVTNFADYQVQCNRIFRCIIIFMLFMFGLRIDGNSYCYIEL